MNTSSNYVTTPELEQGLADVLDSPKDVGRLDAIFVRLKENVHDARDVVVLSSEGGIEGDRWSTDHWQTLSDGRSDPSSQVSLINARLLKLIAGQSIATSLVGDNLVVDLDLSDENLPPGTRVRIGDTVVLEISDEAHTGCGTFSDRYGTQVCQFVNSARGKSLNLRGCFARILEGGTIKIGGPVSKTSGGQPG